MRLQDKNNFILSPSFCDNPTLSGKKWCQCFQAVLSSLHLYLSSLGILSNLKTSLQRMVQEPNAKIISQAFFGHRHENSERKKTKTQLQKTKTPFSQKLKTLAKF